ncbi:MAG: endopeptidase La [Pelagibacterales bacterium]|nr:endopeptidase La [Pelagibacterales bacterium]
MTEQQIQPQVLCALPLRDVVIFPNMTTTILVGREKSVNGIEETKRLNVPIFAVLQTNPDSDEFNETNIHKVGVICKIVESIRTVDGTLKVIIQGLLRAEIKSLSSNGNYFTCEVAILSDAKFVPDSEEKDKKSTKEILSLVKGCVENFSKYATYNKRITSEVLAALVRLKSPHEIAYMITINLNSTPTKKQKVLEETNLAKKLYKVLELLKIELEISQSEARINKSIQDKVAKANKEFYLNEQLKNIKKELGQDEETEFKELSNKIAKLKLPKEVSEKCKTELAKLEKMNPFSSESGVVRNYLDWIISLPWSTKSKPSNDLNKAHDILDKNHFALDKVKDRILEFIAVQIKTKALRGPILCLVGSPGVGKTSLAKSIADSLNRKYVKVSLGGVRDESEIRGHRRTYIGSMPGRIIQSMRKAGTVNPLMLLDEIDKMSHDFRGDPSAALLEVLDPEQNNNFSDHYLEVDYDLSQVMFVATANSLSSIPVPLRDRMEIIKLSGYTENEKLQIVKKHLVHRQCKENGLTGKEFSISDEAILVLIREYTFEAGVRNLNREIANLARKAVKEIITKKTKALHITKENIAQYAGVAKHHFGIAKEKDLVGVTTGLAYTDFGGDLLDIEVLKFEGHGKTQITGKLGDVMKESAKAALSYSRSIAQNYKIDAKKFSKYDFHIHVPEGATPKDGPSAGVALCVSLISSISGIPVKKDIAMTGEITLTGKVLEIGGLKEKLLAALRGGIKTVLIPESNRKNLSDMPKEVLDKLTIKPIKTIDEALNEALVLPKKPAKKKK